MAEIKTPPVTAQHIADENAFEDGVWTYAEDAIWSGLQAAYADLVADVRRQGAELTAYGVDEVVDRPSRSRILAALQVAHVVGALGEAGVAGGA